MNIIISIIFLIINTFNPTAGMSGQGDTQRKDDLSRIMTAITDYMSNNSGRTPFSAGTLNPNFVTRYIDESCSSDADFSRPASSQDACTSDQFRDPDGNLYYFSIKDGANLSTNDKVPGIANSFASANHAIYTVLGVSCGPKDGTVTMGSSARQVALYMILEDDSVTCVANN